jgi:hypothetical protein
MATTLGALSGAAAGDSLTDTDYDDPSIPGRDDVEGDTDLQQDMPGFVSGALDTLKNLGTGAAADAIKGGFKAQHLATAASDAAKAAGNAAANTDIGQKAIGAMSQASDWAADKGASIGSKIGSALGGAYGGATDGITGAGIGAGLGGYKGAEIGRTVGKYAPAAAAAGAGLAGASMLGGDNDDKQESSGDFEKSTTEPNEKYWDHDTMVNKLSGGLNRKKKMYKPASQGDNAMAIESMKARLLKALGEASKKAKPDFLDMDKDGNKKEPMKKAVADKKKMVRPTEAITNWKGEEVDPQVGDIVRLYGGGHRPIKGVIVGPGNGRFEGSFAIKFKNLRGDIVVDSFYAKDEFEIIQKASTNEAKKTKPDFLDMDKDGNKKEPMKKAVADKKEKAPVKEAVNESTELVHLKHFLKRLNG